MTALWLGIYFAVLIWSGVAPKDTLIWFLEVLPALLTRMHDRQLARLP